MTLSKVELAAYQDEGLLFPKRVLSASEAADNLAELESYEATTGGPVNGKWRYKSHLVFPWINRLMRHPNILALASSVLGEDLMVWTTHIYPKEAGDGRFISWHQDSAHWGLDSNQILTVWIALTDATKDNGCMRMLPRSHKNGTVSHSDTWDPDNILTRGQTITDEINEQDAVWIELKAGEVSLHHVYMFHASKPNFSDNRRVGLAIRYITPAARQTRVDEDYATLVSGKDRFGHFNTEIVPATTMAREAVAFHARLAELQGQIYLANTDRAGISGLTETNVAQK
ncbi:MAG: phytanoyl-CoA dioxygenase family protein [Pseudomonadota bacterium]|jgi:chlorinating enzyme|nr:phytanoyl-CoA dioxygenase family protein [Pseudomonadota bacterium]MEE2804635.1 phytanoyl-CoA dioxygenase family protein [Pseudomonadota bacterium]